MSSKGGGLDAFLDLFDADPDWDSSDDDDPFKRLDETLKSKPQAKSAANVNVVLKSTCKSPICEEELTFEQLFGVPFNKKSQTIESNNKPFVKSKSLSTKSKAISQEQIVLKPLPSYPGNGVLIKRSTPTSTLSQPIGETILDPFSKTRLVKSSVHLTVGQGNITLQACLQERNTGMQQVCLSTLPRWFRCGGNKDKLQFWTTGVLSRKPPGLRKSSKGNDYALWELVDLNNVEQPWTVFLFGSAATASALATIAPGSLVDFLNPTILEDSVRVKLSICNSNQVYRVGEAKDFGYCQSKRKDGNACTAIVNTFDCPVCIHHASSELRKANNKMNKSLAGKTTKMGAVVLGGRGSGNKNGVMITDFGPLAPQPKATNDVPLVGKKQLVRMELQDPSNILKRNPASLGNHTSISFAREVNPLQLPITLKKPAERKIIVLDPLKTRHLTEKDRQILDALSGSSSTTNTELPNLLSNPNAGAKNFLKYLNRSSGKGREEVKEIFTSGTPEPEVGTKLTMTRETMENMQKALNYVKKNGPISKKAGTKNSNVMKRKLSDNEVDSSGKLININTAIEKKKSAQSEEFERIVAAKSAHAGLAEELQESDYFEKHERKEAVENKLLNTFKIPTTAVMCRVCKYVALSRSDLCKDLGHDIRVVKAIKRFFKCKQCGNRAMSLDRLPKRPCTNCKSSSWIVTSAGREKVGPTLASESLCIRGDEEKFLGSTSGKMFLN